MVALGNGHGLANTVMSMVPSKQGSFIFGRVSGRGKLTNEHHTIPVYLCGAESKVVQRAAVIDAGLHDAIHDVLDKVTAAVNISGAIVDRLFNRKRAKINKPTIVRVAQKKMGRAVMANALRVFYEYYDLMGEGGYYPGTLTIGEAFDSYRPKFVNDRSKTSYPRCSRR